MEWDGFDQNKSCGCLKFSNNQKHLRFKQESTWKICLCIKIWQTSLLNLIQPKLLELLQENQKLVHFYYQRKRFSQFCQNQPCKYLLGKLVDLVLRVWSQSFQEYLYHRSTNTVNQSFPFRPSAMCTWRVRELIVLHFTQDWGMVDKSFRLTEKVLFSF